MFIRKRRSQTKKWGTREFYEVCKIYRKEGKIKHRVVCNLGPFSTPKLALEREKQIMEQEARKLETGFYTFREYRHYIEKLNRKRIKRIKELEAVVSKMKATS